MTSSNNFKPGKTSQISKKIKKIFHGIKYFSVNLNESYFMFQKRRAERQVALLKHPYCSYMSSIKVYELFNSWNITS